MHSNCLWNERSSCFKDRLRKSELDSTVEKSSNTTSKFGDGKSVPARKKVILPTDMGNKKANLETDADDVDIPLLSSEATINKARAVLGVNKDFTIFGQE